MASKKSPEFEINPSRLLFLLDLYKMSEDFFISLLNKDLGKPILNKEGLKKILKKEMGVGANVLKRIDKIFHKGLTWVISGRETPEKAGSSIFFRKDKFNTELSFESKKFINTYEELKSDILTMSNHVGFNQERKIKKYSIKDDPKKAAQEIFEEFFVAEQRLIEKKIIKSPENNRDYLKNLIRIIEEFNIFVFEFVETWNKKNKAEFDGFFISPNVIVIKRQQKYLRREILTLMHEFSHYLLNEEEIDTINDSGANKVLSANEQWCYSFAFYFLLGRQADIFNEMSMASNDNNFYQKKVEQLYQNTFLSTSAIYMRLNIEKKIASEDFYRIIDDIKKNIREAERIERLKRESLKEAGIEQSGRAPMPIESSLFKELVKVNYFEGNIGESDLRGYLNIKPEKSLEEAIY